MTSFLWWLSQDDLLWGLFWLGVGGGWAFLVFKVLLPALGDDGEYWAGFLGCGLSAVLLLSGVLGVILAVCGVVVLLVGQGSG